MTFPISIRSTNNSRFTNTIQSNFPVLRIVSLVKWMPLSISVLTTHYRAHTHTHMYVKTHKSSLKFGQHLIYLNSNRYKGVPSEYCVICCCTLLFTLVRASCRFLYIHNTHHITHSRSCKHFFRVDRVQV